jgi:hypothetical protein
MLLSGGDIAIGVHYNPFVSFEKLYPPHTHIWYLLNNIAGLALWPNTEKSLAASFNSGFVS